MKINNSNLEGAAPSGSGKAQESQRIERDLQLTTPGARPGSGSDRVELSAMVGRLARALETGAASHADRVAQLADAYRRGAYQVDPTGVAKSLLEASLS